MITAFSRNVVFRTDKIKVQYRPGNEWVGTSEKAPKKELRLSTAPNGKFPTPVDAVLMAAGACSADDVKYFLEKNKVDVKGMRIDVEGKFADKGPSRVEDIKIRYKVDSHEVRPEDVTAVGAAVLKEICPVVNTLVSKPEIHAKAILIK